MFRLLLQFFLLALGCAMIFCRIPCSERFLLFTIRTMGPFFIKMGQFFSTREDIVGLRCSKILKVLCDNVTDKSQNNIRIPDFIENPVFVSSASIACVYKGSFIGKNVAIKIVKPKIREIILINILCIKRISRFLLRFIIFKRLNLNKIVAEFEDMMNQEINMLNEAKNIDHMRLLFYDNKEVKIPKIYYNLSNNDMMVMEWIDGVKVDKICDLNLSSNERCILAKKLISSFMIQYYDFGFFHADPHNGNILLSKNYIGILDFGMCAKINSRDKFYVTKIVHDFVSKKYEEVALFHREIGYIPGDTNVNDFAIECRKIGDSIFGGNNQLSIGNLMFLLFEVSKKFGMEIQPHLLMLQRSIIMIEGMAKNIDPSIDIWNVMKGWMSENLGIEYYTRIHLLHIKRFINKII
jgi:ubiquinone biosynthesis protein